MRSMSLISLCVCLLMACSPDKPPEKTVFDTQVQALKKARQVEDQVKQNAGRERQAIETIDATPAE